MAEVVRELWRSPYPLGPGPPRAGCLGPHPDRWLLVSGEIINNLPVQPVPVFAHPHNKDVPCCSSGSSFVSVYIHCFLFCH